MFIHIHTHTQTYTHICIHSSGCKKKRRRKAASLRDKQNHMFGQRTAVSSYSFFFNNLYTYTIYVYANTIKFIKIQCTHFYYLNKLIYVCLSFGRRYFETQMNAGCGGVTRFQLYLGIANRQTRHAAPAGVSVSQCRFVSPPQRKGLKITSIICRLWVRNRNYPLTLHNPPFSR